LIGRIVMLACGALILYLRNRQARLSFSLQTIIASPMMWQPPFDIRRLAGDQPRVKG